MTFISAVLFDLDGTLIDSARDLATAYNTLLTQHGHDTQTEDRFRQDITLGLGALFERDFSANPRSAKRKKLRDEFTAIYLQIITEHTQFFPGIESALTYLSQENIPWGIVTNKAERFTNVLMHRLPPLQKAAVVVCGDTLPRKKPHPQPLIYACERLNCIPAQTVMIGDTETDMVAAKRAGTQALAVGYNGMVSDETARAWGAQGVVQTPEDLSRWFQLHSS